ncbi:MAG: XisI protein [Lewinellaceae bacterium]|nr:XisI protein [Lewinellaceae bacterium]MCB9296044.1 XisI protein [Lewinellaceae bacterium]
MRKSTRSTARLWRCPERKGRCFDIIDGKAWVQANNTEEMVGDDLIRRGVLREDIILGFQPEYARKYSGFGVA